MKQVIIAVVAVIAIIGGAVVLGKDEEVTGATSNHVYGKADSTVQLVEYGDFECPACAAYYPIIETVKEKYKDKIAFQYKHFPLVQNHQNALAAHRAAEAAGKQGKFWEMYNQLYDNIESWNGPSNSDPVGVQTDAAIAIFNDFASQIGLDVERFKTDFAAAETAATINADIAEGKEKYNVTGTPTFIFNGQKVEDLTSMDTVEELSAMIDEALGETSGNNAATEDQAKPEETAPTN